MLLSKLFGRGVAFAVLLSASSSLATEYNVPLLDTGYYMFTDSIFGVGKRKFNLPAYFLGGRSLPGILVEERRHYFVFDLPSIPQEEIVSATLRVFAWTQCPHAGDERGCAYASEDAVESVEYVIPFGLSPALVMDPGGSQAGNFSFGPEVDSVFDAFANGAVAATVSMAPVLEDQWIDIPLTGLGAVLLSAKANGGGAFAIAGRVTSFSSYEAYADDAGKSEELFVDHLIPFVPAPQLILVTQPHAVP